MEKTYLFGIFCILYAAANITKAYTIPNINGEPNPINNLNKEINTVAAIAVEQNANSILSNQKQNVLYVDEARDAFKLSVADSQQYDAGDDMEVAETHVFRPLFRYRAKLEDRRKINKIESDELVIGYGY